MSAAIRPALPHLAISASAGSGKTYALSTRYLALLAQGRDPRSLVALTFTRKAAGEMFVRIIERLARAAQTREALDELNAALAPAGVALDAAAARARLRGLVRQWPALRIGTLDGFFHQIVRAFPLELGLRGDFELVDEWAQALERQRTLRAALKRFGDAPAERRAFIEQLRAAEYGREQRRVSERLDEFIRENYAGLFLAQPSADTWGAAPRIWPDGCAWFQPVIPPTKDDLRDFRAAQEAAGGARFWNPLLDAWADGSPEFRALPDTVSGRLERLAEVWPELDGLTFNRKELPLTADQKKLVRRMVRQWVQTALALRLHGTRAMYRILAAYDAEYERSVRAAGRLTFSDLPFLLTRRNPALDEIGRLQLDYRLDGCFTNWLLDEFQDTSRLQWAALANLADEALQADDDTHSFFYVGDPKQAIYGWRGGAAALFDEVRDRYAPRLQTDHLDTSWRSAPPIIDVVNRVFGGLDAEGRLPEATRERWSRHWHEHRAAPPRRHAPGYAAFYELPRGRADAENAQRRWTAAVALTAELQRRRPGVEVALLVRKNNAGRELCEQLRAAGLPASLEGESPLAEHPVVHDLLALLRLAEHPGDTLAWGAVRFSPLGVALPPGQSAGEVAAELARSLAEEGYARTLQRWMERTAPEYVAADSAAARRWRLLLEAAEAYDARPDGDPLDFADFVGGYGLPESVAVCPVRVMTIHKAKGLEFEIVILPELQGRGLLTADLTGLAQYHPPDGSGWTLDMPPRALADFDDTLRARRNGWIAEHAYEELCNLYVAVTRARAGLYLIATAPAKDSKTLYAADLVRARLPSAEEPPEIPLGGETARRIFETGDEAALLRSDAAGAVAPSPLPAVAPEWPVRSPGARRPRLQRRTPSGAERRIRTGRELFLDSGVGAAEHGTLMHALFEQFGWWGEDDPDVARTRWAEQWRPAPAARARAEQEFRAALAGAEIQSALTRPAAPAGGTVELWRERKFEIVLGEEWISGCFDRVVVRRDAAGTVVGAEVLDYKSVSAVDENTLATYRPQLQLYIRVLSRLLACPPDRIAARLIFTRQTTTVACASLICS